MPLINELTLNLPSYPMEELKLIKREVKNRGKQIFDFGTGDPLIPLWPKINETIINSLTPISQYPSVRGIEELREAQKFYMRRRFSIIVDEHTIDIYPTNGSKEAIFHILLSIIDKDSDKKYIIYPDPGYPVYKTSALFAGGIPYPLKLCEENDYKMQPWTLPPEIQRHCAAIWVNYPHNPTGYNVSKDYWSQLLEWAYKVDCMVLSDDCYIDIYNEDYDVVLDNNPQDDRRPVCILTLGYKNVISFHSLSKRSGFTGYRSGFIVGDAQFLKAHLKARANFGTGSPEFIQKAAAVAWNDDTHVRERRKIFTQRMKLAGQKLKNLGMLKNIPDTTFYLWCKVPEKYGDNDVKFCKDLAEHTGIIVSPSSWLSEYIKGYCRFALVPSCEDTQKALDLLEQFIYNN